MPCAVCKSIALCAARLEGGGQTWVDEGSLPDPGTVIARAVAGVELLTEQAADRKSRAHDLAQSVESGSERRGLSW